jgi:hypothetical protein
LREAMQIASEEQVNGRTLTQDQDFADKLAGIEM